MLGTAGQFWRRRLRRPKPSFRGREVICPGPFGSITAGADKNCPLDYSHLNIQGYACGAKGLPKGVVAGTGMSPWGMMNERGVQTLHLQSLTNEFVANGQGTMSCVPRANP